MAKAAILSLACASAGAMITHCSVSSFRSALANREAQRRESRVNGSHARAQEKHCVLAAPAGLATRCFQWDHTNQTMAASSTSLHAQVKAVKNLLEAGVGFP